MKSRILLHSAFSIGAFILASGASYFLRSDGFGRSGVADGVQRCGFPLLFWKRGGFIAHEDFYFMSLTADFVICTVAGIILAKMCFSTRADR